jgi:hypothetical protein
MGAYIPIENKASTGECISVLTIMYPVPPMAIIGVMGYKGTLYKFFIMVIIFTKQEILIEDLSTSIGVTHSIF